MSRKVEVTIPAYEYTVRLRCLVPVDRVDLCKEIVDNVYGPFECEIIAYGPVTSTDADVVTTDAN